MAVLVVALSRPSRSAETVPRIGLGAPIVLLLDRSRSMDEPFYGPERPRVPVLAMPAGESKGAVARRLLGEFTARRHDDLFAMVASSDHPIVILPFTQKHTLVQAAIEAGDIGKGLAETYVGVDRVQAVGFYSGIHSVGALGTGTALVFFTDDHEAPLVNPTLRPRFGEQEGGR